MDSSGANVTFRSRKSKSSKGQKKLSALDLTAFEGDEESEVSVPLVKPKKKTTGGIQADTSKSSGSDAKKSKKKKRTSFRDMVRGEGGENANFKKNFDAHAHDDEDLATVQTIKSDTVLKVNWSSLKSRSDPSGKPAASNQDEKVAAASYTRDELERLKSETYSQSMRSTGEESSSTSLPSMEAIRRARAQRSSAREGDKERVRREQIDSGDYLPLSKEPERISMSLAAQQSKPTDVHDDVFDEEEDEEVRRWELSRLKTATGTASSGTTHSLSQQDSAVHSTAGACVMGVFGNVLAASHYKDRTDVDADSDGYYAPATYEDAMKDVQKALNRLRIRVDECDAQIDQTRRSMAQSSQKLQVLASKAIPEAEQRTEYYRDLWTWIVALDQLLKAKAPRIEELEARLYELYRNWGKSYRKWKRSERKALQAHISDVLGVAVSQLTYVNSSGDSDMMDIAEGNGGRDSDSVSDEDEAEEERNGGLDEFGRDRSYFRKSRERKVYEEWRQRLHAHRESSTTLFGKLGDFEESVTAQKDFDYFSGKLAELRNDAKLENVFGDVREDLCEMREVISKFEEWRRQHQQSYRAVYVADSIPVILAPWVRLGLIGWEMGSVEKTLEDEPFFDTLLQYGADAPDSATEHTVLPTLTASLCVPLFAHFVRWRFNPCSAEAFGHRYVWDVAAFLEVFFENPAKELQPVYENFLTAVKSDLSDYFIVAPHAFKPSKTLQSALLTLSTTPADFTSADFTSADFDSISLSSVEEILLVQFFQGCRLLRLCCAAVLKLKVGGKSLERLVMDELVFRILWPLVNSFDSFVLAEGMINALTGDQATPTAHPWISDRLRHRLEEVCLKRFCSALAALNRSNASGEWERRVDRFLVVIGSSENVRRKAEGLMK